MNRSPTHVRKAEDQINLLVKVNKNEHNTSDEAKKTINNLNEVLKYCLYIYYQTK